MSKLFQLKRWMTIEEAALGEPVQEKDIYRLAFVYRFAYFLLQRDTHSIPVCKDCRFLEKLIDSNGLLDKINKGLNAYLEKKRLFFPRLVFVVELMFITFHGFINRGRRSSVDACWPSDQLVLGSNLGHVSCHLSPHYFWRSPGSI